MTNEQLAVFIALIGLAGTGFNVWIALSIKASVLGVKLWATDKFVSKDDMSNYLSPIKDSIQMVGSGRRLNNLDPGHEPARR